VSSLARVVGDERARLILARAILLGHPSPRPWFAAQPTKRVREVERARREQIALAGRLQVGR